MFIVDLVGHSVDLWPGVDDVELVGLCVGIHDHLDVPVVVWCGVVWFGVVVWCGVV